MENNTEYVKACAEIEAVCQSNGHDMGKPEPIGTSGVMKWECRTCHNIALLLPRGNIKQGIALEFKCGEKPPQIIKAHSPVGENEKKGDSMVKTATESVGTKTISGDTTVAVEDYLVYCMSDPDRMLVAMDGADLVAYGPNAEKLVELLSGAAKLEYVQVSIPRFKIDPDDFNILMQENAMANGVVIPRSFAPTSTELAKTETPLEAESRELSALARTMGV